ncbi:MAG: preprotein translocase subunit SecY [Deltaproteobacteria bacterium]|nr:preprotein translocase subunit SecY [Deltaproteobacteria bacterium]
MALGAILNVGKIPELRRRLLFTLGMLAVYRVGVYVTVPGADRKAMQEFFVGQDTQGGGGFLNLMNLFSGGALEQVSIFALGVMPYVSASIIFQLLTSVFKPLEEMRKEGEMGQRKINQYTRYATILLSLFQGFSIALYLEGRHTADMVAVVRDPGWMFRIITMLTLATGTAFIMWIGEQITERGIGNGISLIIFAGIVADFPKAAAQTWQGTSTGQIQPTALLIAGVLIVASVATIVFFERGQRRIPIEYSRRIIGRKMYGGQRTHLPLRVNSSGVIPPIFASSVLLFPGTLASLHIPGMEALSTMLQRGDWLYVTVFSVATIFFCYFYTAVTFPPVDVADNLKKQGAFIPSIRPGKATADYIEKVLARITFGGALYVALICVLPDFMRTYFKVPFPFGGTSIMIVVGVALDTVNQIESYLISRHYEGFAGAGGPRIQGRRSM